MMIICHATTVANNTTQQKMTSVMKSGYVVQSVPSGHMNHALKQMALLTKLAMAFCANHVVTEDVDHMDMKRRCSIKQLFNAVLLHMYVS